MDFEIVINVSERLLLQLGEIHDQVHAAVGLGHVLLVAFTLEYLALQRDEADRQGYNDLDMEYARVEAESVEQIRVAFVDCMRKRKPLRIARLPPYLSDPDFLLELIGDHERHLEHDLHA